MHVPEDVVATVRALLQGDTDGYRQRFAAMDKSRENLAAYKAMAFSAFHFTVRYKFSKDTARSEIIDYIAEIRARSDDLPETIDPAAAERMISAMFTGASTDDIDTDMELTIQMLLATAIVDDERIEGRLFEDLITAARKLADDLLN